MFDGPPRLETAPSERRARLRLARTPRIGAVGFHQALAHFGSAEAACDALRVTASTIVDREEESLAGFGGQFVVFGDADYPEPLAALPDAPPLLSAIGNLELLKKPTIAIVGGRDASLAGRRMAADLATALGRAGRVVASGLARGIDSAAHEAALPFGTIAVLACGIDQVYPPENGALQDKIASQGLLLSEVPLRTPPVARAFPRRNRIVSGLSEGVVVIEAAERSGSLITAHRAAEQGRDVFVVPGSPLDPRYAGSNGLIRDGAILIRHAKDILDTAGGCLPAGQATVNKQEISSGTDMARVLEALGPTPTAVDELVRRCQVSAASLAEVLFALELEGRLERHRGNLVSLI